MPATPPSTPVRHHYSEAVAKYRGLTDIYSVPAVEQGRLQQSYADRGKAISAGYKEMLDAKFVSDNTGIPHVVIPAAMTAAVDALCNELKLGAATELQKAVDSADAALNGLTVVDNPEPKVHRLQQNLPNERAALVNLLHTPPGSSAAPYRLAQQLEAHRDQFKRENKLADDQAFNNLMAAVGTKLAALQDAQIAAINKRVQEDTKAQLDLRDREYQTAHIAYVEAELLGPNAKAERKGLRAGDEADVGKGLNQTTFYHNGSAIHCDEKSNTITFSNFSCAEAAISLAVAKGFKRIHISAKSAAKDANKPLDDQKYLEQLYKLGVMKGLKVTGYQPTPALLAWEKEFRHEQSIQRLANPILRDALLKTPKVNGASPVPTFTDEQITAINRLDFTNAQEEKDAKGNPHATTVRSLLNNIGHGLGATWANGIANLPSAESMRAGQQQMHPAQTDIYTLETRIKQRNVALQDMFPKVNAKWAAFKAKAAPTFEEAHELALELKLLNKLLAAQLADLATIREKLKHWVKDGPNASPILQQQLAKLEKDCEKEIKSCHALFNEAVENAGSALQDRLKKEDNRRDRTPVQAKAGREASAAMNEIKKDYANNQFKESLHAAAPALRK